MRSHLAEALAAVETILQDGDNDALAGGASVPAVAAELEISEDAANNRLVALQDQGQLVKVWGADPETGQPRKSFIPPEHPLTKPLHERD